MRRYALVAIILLALVIRLYHISTNPPGFFCDEASIGYNAYLITKTGADEWHAHMPIFFRSFGEYRNPLEVYATIPFIKLLGLNSYAVRITSIFFSIASIIVFYAIGAIWSTLFGLLLALLFAITPWTVHLSKTGFVAENIYVFCLLVSFYALLQARNNKRLYVFLFFVSCIIGLYAYFSSYITYPLLVLFGIIFLWRYTNKSYLCLGLIMVYLSAVPLATHLYSGTGFARFKQVSILKSNMHPVQKFGVTYALHFSPDYLFFKGDAGMPGQGQIRNSLSGIGEMFIWELPGIILGIYFLFKQKHQVRWIILFLLVIYPIPSSITVELSPAATRSVMGVIPLTFLAGYGYYSILGALHKKNRFEYYLLLVMLVAAIMFSIYTLFSLLGLYERTAGGYYGWQYGMKESLIYLKDHEKEYNALYVTHRFNSPGELMRFYNVSIHCTRCTVISNPIIVDRYHKQLFALRKDDILEAYEQYDDITFVKLKTIRSPGGVAQLFIGYFVFSSEHSGK